MKTSQFLSRSFLTFAVGGLISGAAMADVALPTLSSVACTTDSFYINTIEKSPLNGLDIIYPTSSQTAPIRATGCQGVFLGNDYGGNAGPGISLSDMGRNIGELDDGLLNGEGGVLSTTWFQPPPESGYPKSPLLDIDGDGAATDPGWIRLGKIEEGGLYESDTSTFGGKTLDIGDILNVTMKCDGSGCTSGTWSLSTELDIIEQVQELLGRNAFDHLAFVIKTSTKFAVYDFDFNILSQELPNFDYTTPYSFTGSWNTGDFPNPSGNNSQNISHLSIWARDPQAVSEIPEPASALLVGLGLLAFGLRRRTR